MKKEYHKCFHQTLAVSNIHIGLTIFACNMSPWYIHMVLMCLALLWLYYEFFVDLCDLFTDIFHHQSQWCHNEHDCISNHQPHHCLLNHLFKAQINETWKLHITGFVRGIHRWPVNSPHKGPVVWKRFPFVAIHFAITTLPQGQWGNLERHG